VDDLTKQRREIDTADDDLNRQLKSAQSLLEIAKERIDSLRNDYSEAKGATFTFSEVKCPKCGTVLNEDEEKREKQDFDNSKQKKLLELIEKGKAAKTELTKQQSLVDSLNKRKSENSDARKKELDVAIINASKSLDIKRQILNGEMNPDPVEYSEDPKKLEEEISELEKKISQAETETSSDINERLEKYRQSTISNLSMAQQVLDELTVYNDAQRKIADENVKLNELNHRLNQELELKDMISGFIRVKLEMINASTKKVFPDIDFVLVRPNIKEGSWDEVCYPLIKGKKTPFADGSGSEKIVTSLAIIEDVRKALGLEDTVLIFDEGETLDSETIKSLDTESQVITSVVNDSYSEPTAVVLGK
jgi:chromosome segregation ATPase